VSVFHPQKTQKTIFLQKRFSESHRNHVVRAHQGGQINGLAVEPIEHPASVGTASSSSGTELGMASS
jgi:hypothetical protein